MAGLSFVSGIGRVILSAGPATIASIGVVSVSPTVIARTLEAGVAAGAIGMAISGRAVVIGRTRPPTVAIGIGMTEMVPLGAIGRAVMPALMVELVARCWMVPPPGRTMMTTAVSPPGRTMMTALVPTLPMPGMMAGCGMLALPVPVAVTISAMITGE